MVTTGSVSIRKPTPSNPEPGSMSEVRGQSTLPLLTTCCSAPPNSKQRTLSTEQISLTSAACPARSWAWALDAVMSLQL